MPQLVFPKNHLNRSLSTQKPYRRRRHPRPKQGKLFFILNRKFHKSKVVQRCLYSYRQRHSSSQWSKCCGQQIFDTVMTNVVVDKSTDTAEPLSICFLPQYSTPKKVFISERGKNHDTTKEQALSITFSQYDWFIFQNGTEIQTTVCYPPLTILISSILL